MRRASSSDTSQIFTVKIILADSRSQFSGVWESRWAASGAAMRGGVKLTVAASHPGSGRQCDSVAMVRRDSLSGELSILWEAVGRWSPASPSSRGHRNTLDRSNCEFSAGAALRGMRPSAPGDRAAVRPVSIIATPGVRSRCVESSRARASVAQRGECSTNRTPSSRADLDRIPATAAPECPARRRSSLRVARPITSLRPRPRDD